VQGGQISEDKGNKLNSDGERIEVLHQLVWQDYPSRVCILLQMDYKILFYNHDYYLDPTLDTKKQEFVGC
jgi:hypothetical protein